MTETSAVLPRRLLRAVPLALLSLGMATSARASEITAFVSGGRPSSVWGNGYGGMLTISLFDFVYGEIEGAYQHGEAANTSLVSGSGKAYVGPTIGRLVPYVGLGVGGYHASLAVGSDNGRLGSVFAGVKLKFPIGLVIRGEYQWLDMPSEAPLKLDGRYFVGAGLRF